MTIPYKFITIFTAVLSLCSYAMAKNAEQVFDDISSAVYQIRIIDNKSAEKVSIGSAFILDYKNKHYMISNYHVISEYALHPDKNRIEYHNNGVKQGDLKLVAIDVVHDLALLEGFKDGKAISLAPKEVRQGGKIFSLGNPLDLGLTITEGTHNGYKQLSWREILMFSGALNPGMSGGAGVNDIGELMGVNVATQGNDVGFFVPAKFVAEMIDNYETKKYTGGWMDIIQNQILEEEVKLVADLKKRRTHWERPEAPDDKFVRLPQDIHEAIKCWGGSSDESDADNRFNITGKYCSANDNIFVRGVQDFQTFELQSRRYENKELSTVAFYTLYSGSHNTYTSFVSDKRHCRNGFLKNGGENWKTIMCVSKKKDFSKLYDVGLVMTLIGHSDIGQTIKFELKGFSMKGSQELIKAFVEETK